MRDHEKGVGKRPVFLLDGAEHKKIEFSENKPHQVSKRPQRQQLLLANCSLESPIWANRNDNGRVEKLL